MPARGPVPLMPAFASMSGSLRTVSGTGHECRVVRTPLPGLRGRAAGIGQPCGVLLSGGRRQETVCSPGQAFPVPDPVPVGATAPGRPGRPIGAPGSRSAPGPGPAGRVPARPARLLVWLLPDTALAGRIVTPTCPG